MSTTALRDELRRRLTRARVDRDKPLAGALRSALAALENAEAVPAGTATGETEHVAGAVAFGAGEAERRLLTGADEREILAAEIASLREAADQYDGAGQPDAASAARRAADVLASLGST